MSLDGCPSRASARAHRGRVGAGGLPPPAPNASAIRHLSCCDRRHRRVGSLPEFTRRGFGKHLLTEAVRHAWAEGARRVWLHTCTLDHPAALPNYVARGFRPFKTERYVTETP